MWVTRHELTHSYMLEKLSQVMQVAPAHAGLPAAAVVHRGAARSSAARTWDEDAEGCCATPCSPGEALPLSRSEPIAGTVLMYKEGQSFLLYLAEHYGQDKVFDMLDNWYRADDFETVFRHHDRRDAARRGRRLVRGACGAATTRWSPRRRAPAKLRSA